MRAVRWTVLASCCAIAALAALAAPAGAAPKWTLSQLPSASGDRWGPPLSGVSCPSERPKSDRLHAPSDARATGTRLILNRYGHPEEGD
jgi:hypothetical protein